MGKGAGAGKGKGGCGVCDAIGDAVQCVVGGICCFCVSGPVLIVIGVLFLISAVKNHRADRIDEFKVAVNEWRNGAVDGWDSLASEDFAYTFNSSCASLSVSRRGLPRTDAAENLGAESGEGGTFGAYTRVKFSEVTPASPMPSRIHSSGTGCSIGVTVLYKGANIDNWILYEDEGRTRRYGASDLGCYSSDTSTYKKREQAMRRCYSSCDNRGGVSYGNSLNTFDCQVVEMLAAVCVRVKKSNDTYVMATDPINGSSRSGAGCFVDQDSPSWETAQYVTTRQGVPDIKMTVRHEDDPYLDFVDITDGSLDFGLTAGEKSAIGISALFIGAFFLSMSCLACCCVYKFALGFANGKQERPNNAVGGVAYDVAAKYGNYLPGGVAIGHPAPNQGIGHDVELGTSNQATPYKPDGSDYQYGPGSAYKVPSDYQASQQPPATYGQPPLEQAPYYQESQTPAPAQGGYTPPPPPSGYPYPAPAV